MQRVQTFLTVKQQLVVPLVEESVFAQLLNVVVAHPLDGFHLVLLQAEHLGGDVAFHHVKQGEFIVISSDSHQFKLTLGRRQANLLLQFAQHGNGKIPFPALHMACGGGVVIALS